MTQPSNARGGNTRKVIGQAKGRAIGKASTKVPRVGKHRTSSKRSGRMSGIMFD